MKHQQLKTSPEISKRMSHVKTKRNSAEIMIAKSLWHRGYRYRLNYKTLPGSPDIALTKYRIAIFIDGEFWHGKDFEQRKTKLKNNKDYWIEKIQENIDRDLKNDKLLRQMEWYPIHFWSNDVIKYCNQCVEEVICLIDDINNQ
ncbi:very short patch repair endonuclease [Faecalibacillus intestinalis]|jgi:DNA mismatch endonuclease, patch repair protein|uniref:Very short patch repair endonuclease n=1 Tax=Faecalibacillus intestinalis TaxID=1982626 RepID=A0AAW4VHS1_9FIRM|nr:very short patch repair endonuclease [Faecalibacillus intestinalis]MCB8561331.1 very short patch repair endonuclease [Faecalibacillus intestinalis]MCG4809229.1 very short patch repair endonuclease [Faecalibacillus intestinalis]RHR91705.1 very short patch repair endonuclease [Coprobacillus sp. AF15-30]